MTKELEQYINENFPGALTTRSQGVKVWDDPSTVYTSDKLCTIYEMGFHVRDREVYNLETTVRIQEKQLLQKQSFSFIIPWWIGVLIATIAVLHFGLPYFK